MANQIRLTRSNLKRVNPLLDHTKKNAAYSAQTMTSICNLAMGFGWDAVENMFGFVKPKKVK